MAEGLVEFSPMAMPWAEIKCPFRTNILIKK
jgi:hypothetical protein